MGKANKTKTKPKQVNQKTRCVFSPSPSRRCADGDNENDGGKRCRSGSRGRKNTAKTNAAAATLFDGTGDDNINSAARSRPHKSRTPRVYSDSTLTQDFLRIVFSFASKYRNGIFKVLSTVLCTVILTSAAAKRGFAYTPWLDVIVYCGVYSVWVITCLPWLLAKLNTKTLGLIAGIITRLFAADIGVLGWAAFRGDTQILQRGLRLKPIMEPSLSWLASAGYSLRFGVLVSAIAATVVKVILESTQFSNLAASKRFIVSPTKQTSSPPPCTRQRKNRKASNLSVPGSCPISRTVRETTADVYPTTTGMDKSSDSLLHDPEDEIRRASMSIPNVDPTHSSKLSPDIAHPHRTKKDKYKKRYRHFGSPTNVHRQGHTKADISDNNSKLKPSQTHTDPAEKVQNSPANSEQEIDHSYKESDESLALSDMCRKLLKKETIAPPPCTFDGKRTPEMDKKSTTKSKFTLKHKSHAEDTHSQRKTEVKMQNASRVPLKLKNKMVKPGISPRKASILDKTNDDSTSRTNHRLNSKSGLNSSTNKPTKQGDVEERVKKMALFNEKVRQLKVKRDRVQKKRSQSEQPSGSRVGDSQSKTMNDLSADQSKGSLSGKTKTGAGSYSKSMSRRKSIYKSMADDKK